MNRFILALAALSIAAPAFAQEAPATPSSTQEQYMAPAYGMVDKLTAELNAGVDSLKRHCDIYYWSQHGKLVDGVKKEAEAELAANPTYKKAVESRKNASLNKLNSLRNQCVRFFPGLVPPMPSTL